MADRNGYPTILEQKQRAAGKPMHSMVHENTKHDPVYWPGSNWTLVPSRIVRTSNWHKHTGIGARLAESYRAWRRETLKQRRREEKRCTGSGQG